MLTRNSRKFGRLLPAIGLLAAALVAIGATSPAESLRLEHDIRCVAEVRQMDEREQLQLEDAPDMTDVRFGVAVSSKDAARLDRLMGVRQSIDFDVLRDSFIKLLGDQLVSVTWSFVSGVEVRVLPEADTSGVPDLAAKYGLGEDFSIFAVPGAILSERQRVELLETMREPSMLAAFDQAGVFSVEPDELCGTLTLLVRPGSDVVHARDQLAGILSVDSLTIREAAESEVDHDAVGRTDLQTTQSGGLRVVASGGCTSAAPWYQRVVTPYGVFNVQYAVTAAHCVSQSQWSSTPNSWGGVWWTMVTADTNLRQPSTTIASAQARLRYGAELDVAVWRLDAAYQAGSPRSATNSDAHNYIWHNLGWWQWSPTWNTGTSGGDAVGDWVCQSGQTTAFRAPDPAWNTSVIECGSLFNRARSYSVGAPNASWFYSMREASLNLCGGDSGGTIWRAGWYSGILKSGRNGSLPDVNGQSCYEDTTYSHIGYIPGAFNLTAPTGFS